MSGTVQAVSCSPTHSFAKPNQGSIRLLSGLGVEGDAHLGETVKHRSTRSIFFALFLSFTLSSLRPDGRSKKHTPIFLLAC